MSEELRFCPECGSEDLINMEHDIEDGVAIKVGCENCDNYWWEVYAHSFSESKDGVEL